MVKEKKEDKKTDPYRKTAIIIGLLFITATVAGIISAGFLGPILEASDYLVKVNTNENSLLIGALFVVIMGFAGMGIGLTLYPVLKNYDKGIALGAVGFRIVGDAIFCISAIPLLLLVPLSQEFVKAGAPDSSYFQTLGELSRSGLDYGQLIGGLAFSIAAMIYYYIFYQSKFIPRWLSIFGLIAVPLGLVQYLVTYFSTSGPSASSIEILHIPIFIQEMVLAVWLIIKGFDRSELDSSKKDEVITIE